MHMYKTCNIKLAIEFEILCLLLTICLHANNYVPNNLSFSTEINRFHIKPVYLFCAISG